MDCGGLRTQQTLERTAEVTGFGFFTGVDATVRFLPAPENHGIVFKRVDLPGQPTVAANISNVLRSERRTTIVDGAAEVQLIEHIMSAMAGLQVDNVLIEIDVSTGLRFFSRKNCGRHNPHKQEATQSGVAQTHHPSFRLLNAVSSSKGASQPVYTAWAK